MARLCCRRRRTAGGDDFTPTEVIDTAGELAEQLADQLTEQFARPAFPPSAVWEPAGAAAAATDAAYDAARETRELQLADLTIDELLEMGRAVATQAWEQAAAPAVPTGRRSRASADGDQAAGVDCGDPGFAAAIRAAELAERAGIRLPVPRRPWRRVWCWLAIGHLWFPCVEGCLSCGARRRR